MTVLIDNAVLADTTTLGAKLAGLTAALAALGELAAKNFADLAQSGSGAPTASAQFLGQRYKRTSNGDVYVAASVGSGAADWLLDAELAGTNGYLLGFAAGTAAWRSPANARADIGLNTATNSFTVGDGSTVLTTGPKHSIEMPRPGTITGIKLLADISGSVVLDLYKDTYANWPPVNADSITASATPTISSNTKMTDTTLTGWTTSFAAGDIIKFEIESVSTIKQLTVILTVAWS